MVTCPLLSASLLGAPLMARSIPLASMATTYSFGGRNDVPSIVPVALRVHGARPSTLSIRRTRRSEEHTSELQSHLNLVCRLLLEKKNENATSPHGDQPA